MLISVVIPLYNKKKYILRAINSVLRQSYSEIELIIVDDGSTDGSADIVRSVIDNRIRLYSQKNNGVSAARNFGVKKAKAKWVAFLDADDEYEPEFIRECYLFIEKNKQHSLSMVGSNYYIGSKSCIAVDISLQSGVYDYFELFENRQSPNNSSSTIVNKELFKQVHGFPEGVKLFEDWITWFKLSFKGKFGYISTPLSTYYYIENSASLTKKLPLELYRSAALIPKTITKYISENSLQYVATQNAWACINEFTVNIATILAIDGSKYLAIKMLGFIRIKYLQNRRAVHVNKLILHLLIPQFIKKIYRTKKISIKKYILK